MLSYQSEKQASVQATEGAEIYPSVVQYRKVPPHKRVKARPEAGLLSEWHAMHLSIIT